MDIEERSSKKQPRYAELYKLGFLLIGAGVMLLIDQQLNTGWLTYFVPALAGAAITIYSVIHQKVGWTIGGTILLGLGAGLIVGVLYQPDLSFGSRAGAAIIAFSCGWLLMLLLTSSLTQKFQWWILVVTSILTGMGILLRFFPGATLFTYAVIFGAFLGSVLLIWGVVRHLQGLVIAGCLILSMAPGIYYSWINNVSPSSLVRVGTMLVWFALGWFMISFLGRLVFQKFIWWPIIPGGVLAMVGWGLYIGGTAGKQLGFISNTGSVALILFGIYLILLKFGLRK